MPRTTAPRHATLAALTSTAAAAVMLSVGGPAPATAEAPPSSSSVPTVDTHAATSDPLVTPLVAAVIPGPIDVDRTRRSNVVSARIEFRSGATTGWHSHPGAVFVQVASGALTLRHEANGNCHTTVVRAGQGFFEKAGAVHSATNRRAHPVVVFATFVLPIGAPTAHSAPRPAECR